MANWLTKIIKPVSGTKNKDSLPALLRATMPTVMSARSAEPKKSLPNASIIYGAASSVLFVVALYFLFTGAWFTGFLTALPAACFLGFSIYFIKTG